MIRHTVRRRSKHGMVRRIAAESSEDFRSSSSVLESFSGGTELTAQHAGHASRTFARLSSEYPGDMKQLYPYQSVHRYPAASFHVELRISISHTCVIASHACTIVPTVSFTWVKKYSFGPAYCDSQTHCWSA